MTNNHGLFVLFLLFLRRIEVEFCAVFAVCARMCAVCAVCAVCVQTYAVCAGPKEMLGLFEIRCIAFFLSRFGFLPGRRQPAFAGSR